MVIVWEIKLLSDDVFMTKFHAYMESYINLLESDMEKEVSIDSNGYYIGDDLTPEQEQHNLNLDEQIAQGETE